MNNIFVAHVLLCTKRIGMLCERDLHQPILVTPWRCSLPGNKPFNSNKQDQYQRQQTAQFPAQKRQERTKHKNRPQ